MTQPETPLPIHYHFYRNPLLQAGVIFGLALIPRMLALQHFVTADEAKWVYRSAQFLRAILAGDYAGTAVNLTPAVTTTWLGSAGLWIHYQQHQARLNLPFADWLETLPPFSTELGILESVRWPMVIFTAVAIAIIYLLARRLWGWPLAFLGSALLALDPHLLSLSRIIGHDAPVALFMTLSMMTLLLATQLSTETAFGTQGAKHEGTKARRHEEKNKELAKKTSISVIWLVTSGVCGGLALLSKSPAFFLGPFVAVYLGVVLIGLNTKARRHEGTKKSGMVWIRALAIWSVSAYSIFLALWPAVWVAPIEQPWAVIENAFLSATNLDEVAVGDEAERDAYWLVPDWGPLYYLVNGAFKLSPLVMLGLLLSVILAIRNRDWWLTWPQKPLFWLALFALLFIIFMTLGGKRSNRYILPVFPSLTFLAAYGWLSFRWQGKQLAKSQMGLGALIILAALLLLPYAPYYTTYFNPLLGGPFTAPKLVKVGWGEGLDAVGRWLSAQPHPEALRVGSWYASALEPFFAGDVALVEADRLDYVVLYTKQLQAGEPDPAIIHYFSQQMPVQTFSLAGIEYARIYEGPAAQFTTDEANVAGILAYRPQTDYVAIGQDFAVDLIWQVNLVPPNPLPTLNLRWQDETVVEATPIDTVSDQPSSTHRYRFSIPVDLSRGEIELYADQIKVAQLPVYLTERPAHFTPADVTFGDQVRLVGYARQPNIEAGTITVQLAFEAYPKAWADYTIYVHLIDAAGERLAGHDADPNPPTSQWGKAELIIDSHTFPIPPNLPGDQPYRLRIGLYQTGSFEPLGEPFILP